MATTKANQIGYEQCAGIIQQALAERNSVKGDLDHHPKHTAPRFVVRMCDALLNALREAGNSTVTLSEIVRLESTCTGADYHHKLAMRCQSLMLSAAA